MKRGAANRHRALRLTASLIALAVGGLLPTPAAAQTNPFNDYQVFLEGTHCLRRIFFDMKFDPIKSFSELNNADPKEFKDVVVVFLGSTKGMEQLPGGLQALLIKGGAVLIATSSKPADAPSEKAILDRTGRRIFGGTVRYMDQPDEKICYKGRDHCPFLQPVSEEPVARRLFHNPKGEGELKVAANAPSILYRRDTDKARFPRGVSAVAAFPAGRWDGGGHVATVPEPGLLFAVAGDYGSGRFLVMANHRLFLNRMMLLDDTKNVEFAQNCLAYLRERSDGKPRTKLLFVRNGEILSDFNVKLKDVPNPWDNPVDLLLFGWAFMSEATNTLQNKLADMEKHDEFNRAVDRYLERKEITPRILLDRLFFMAAGLFFAYGVFRILGPGRIRPENAPPPLPRQAPEHLPAGSLMTRRHQAMLETGNLYEAARAHARAMFATAAVCGPAAPGPAPKVVTRGSPWQRWRKRRRALRLWQLAFGAAPQIVPTKTWTAIERELNTLKADLSRGEVQYV